MNGHGSSFAITGVSGLSRTARRFVEEHPEEARTAVVAALEAAARVQPARDRPELPDALQPFIEDRPYGDEIVGVSQAAQALRISRTTVYDWVRRGDLLAWSGTKRGLKIPRRQILGPGEVVPGIAHVLKAIGEARLAWAFLSQDWPFENDVARPIEKLRAGEVEAVVAAARSFGTAAA